MLSYGMARHGMRIVAAYVCALSRSPTEDSEARDRISKSRGRGVTYGCIHHMRIPGAYVAYLMKG